MEDVITVHRETIKISDDRNMYLYTFDLEGEPMPEMRQEGIQVPTEPHG